VGLMRGGSGPRAEYRIGKVFYDDHVYRECGATGHIVHEFSNAYVVSLDIEALGDLVSDASYYADSSGFDPGIGLGHLHAAARRTLKALRKQGAPEGYQFKHTLGGLLVLRPE
jgi:hypothetical protein